MTVTDNEGLSDGKHDTVHAVAPNVIAVAALSSNKVSANVEVHVSKKNGEVISVDIF